MRSCADRGGATSSAAFRFPNALITLGRLPFDPSHSGRKGHAGVRAQYTDCLSGARGSADSLCRGGNVEIEGQPRSAT